MQEYEVAVLFHPDLEMDLDQPMKKIEKIFETNGAKLKNTESWGKKKMAYKISGQDHGVYVFYTIDAPKTNVAKIESTLNITDEVIRFLIVKTDERLGIALRQKSEREAKLAEKAKQEPKEKEEAQTEEVKE